MLVAAGDGWRHGISGQWLKLLVLISTHDEGVSMKISVHVPGASKDQIHRSPMTS